jgi:hypothetical protein
LRKTKYVTITDQNRDLGKRFLLTEMSAEAAEEWGGRAVFLAAQSGADVPDAMRIGGIAGIATAGIQAVLGGLPWAAAKPLLAEMMDCVQICPDPRNPNNPRPGPLLPGEIEEVSTRYKLRMELFELHTGFSVGEFLS